MLTILYILYCIAFGIADGYLWGRVSDYDFRLHPHKIASAIRLMVILLLSYSQFYITTFLLIISYSLMFSLWHNGFYYLIRGFKDHIQGYNFFTSSNTSTGFNFTLLNKKVYPFEFSFYNRSIQFVIGLTIIILLYYNNLNK